MPTYENLSPFAETDEDGDITLSATKCDVDTMRRDADSHVEKSYGVGHFTDLTHDFTCEETAFTGAAKAIGGVWGVTNDPGSFEDISDGVILEMYENAPYFVLRDKGNANYDTFAFAENVTYYNTGILSGTTAEMEVYDDAPRTNKLHTMTLTCVEEGREYLMVCFSRDKSDGDAADTITYYSENFDIHEAVAAGQPTWKRFGGIPAMRPPSQGVQVW